MLFVDGGWLRSFLSDVSTFNPHRVGDLCTPADIRVCPAALFKTVRVQALPTGSSDHRATISVHYTTSRPSTGNT